MEQTESINLTGQLSTDKSVVVLLLSNLVTIVLAVYQQWDVFVLMWMYWGQSVVIGYFNVHRILDLKKFSTTGFLINDKPVKPTPETQRKTAVFFAIHYGMFHLGYMVFLGEKTSVEGGFPLFGVVLCIGVFFLNHWYSYRYNREQEQDRVPNIGNIMFFPYIRIIPMHLTMSIALIGWGQQQTLALFLLLKLLADMGMHIVERRGFADYRKKHNPAA